MDEELNIDSEMEDEPLTGEPEASEEMLPKSRVQELVKKAKAKGREKMSEELEQLRRENEALKTQGLGGMRSEQPAQQSFDPASYKDEIKKQIMSDFEADRAKEQRAHLESAVQRMSEDYHRKMEIGKNDYPDFDEVTGEYDPLSSPGLTMLISTLPNAHDVVYEMAKNPNKHVMLEMWAERNPEKAQRELAKLSASIESNKAAKAAEQPIGNPLSRVQPSPLAGQDSGQLDVRDYKRMFRG